MQKLQGTKQVRQLLIDCGIDKDHIFRIYNDKRAVGRRYKIVLSVFGGAITGEKPITDQILQNLRNGLDCHNAQDINITQNQIEFKIR